MIKYKSVINNKYPLKIVETNKEINIYYSKYVQQYWKNHNSLLEKQNIAYSYKLKNNEYTLLDYKNKILNSIKPTKDIKEYIKQIDHLVANLLDFLSLVENQYQYDFPLNPLNIIYNDKTNKFNVIYDYTTKLFSFHEHNVWMDKVVKLIVLLYIPEMQKSLQCFNNTNDDNSSLLYKKFIYTRNDQSDELLSLIKYYGQENMVTLADHVFELINHTKDIKSLLSFLDHKNMYNNNNKPIVENNYSNSNNKSRLKLSQVMISSLLAINTCLLAMLINKSKK